MRHTVFSILIIMELPRLGYVWGRDVPCGLHTKYTCIMRRQLAKTGIVLRRPGVLWLQGSSLFRAGMESLPLRRTGRSLR